MAGDAGAEAADGMMNVASLISVPDVGKVTEVDAVVVIVVENPPVMLTA